MICRHGAGEALDRLRFSFAVGLFAAITLTPPLEAQDEPRATPTSPERAVAAAETLAEPARPYSEILDEVTAALLDLTPLIAEAEDLGSALTRTHRDRLIGELEKLRPLTQELRQRRDEASPEESTRGEEALQLADRLVSAVEKTQAFEAPEEARNVPQVEQMISDLAAYGSIRARWFVDNEGETTFDDATSRAGLRGQVRLGNSWEAFGRYEFGINLLSEINRFLVGGDPGSQDGREGVALPLRLAFLGAEGPAGRLSFGKQWSTYYDVGVFTDQAPFFGGLAQGTYAAGTDGGVSGTGRADLALQYRFAYRDFKFGLQAQIRNETENDPGLVDSFGGSVRFRFNDTLDLGAAYNEVRDGVMMPEDREPKEGNRAAIFGLRWISRDDRNYAAAIYTTFEQHETDDLDRFFDGYGVEIYADRQITERFTVRAWWNYQEPETSHPGVFKIDLVTFGVSYEIEKKWQFYLLYKFDHGRQTDGTQLQADSLGAAIFYNFSRGFSLF